MKRLVPEIQIKYSKQKTNKEVDIHRAASLCYLEM